MKIIITTLTAYLILLINNCYSQEHYLFLNQETVYQQNNFFIAEGKNVQNNEDLNSNSDLFEIGIFSVKYNKLKNNFLSQYKLMPIHISKGDNTTYNTNSQQIADGYSLWDISSNILYSISYIYRGNTNKIRPYTGLGIGIYYNYKYYYPNRATHFSRMVNTINPKVILDLGFIIKLSDMLFLNVQAPINVFNYSICYDKINGPSPLIKNETSKSYEREFFSKQFSLIIGFGMKLNNNKK